MADVNTTTYTSGYSDTMAEDVLDFITNISPMDTVFTSAIGKTTAESTKHEWPQDELDAPQDNAEIEGADIDAAAIVPPTMEDNYTQILTKSFKISDTAERVKKYGRKSEIKYQTAKKLKEIAKDIEFAAINSTAKNAGTAGTARRMMGANGFITTNVGGYAAYANTNALTEDMFNDGMQGAWEEGGDVNCAIVSPKQKREISAFDGYNTLTKNTDADNKKLIASVDYYEGDFGSVAVKAHRYLTKTTDTGNIYSDAYILDTDLWKLSTLGATKTEKLAKTGLSDKYLISTECTLEARQEKGNAKIEKLWLKPE